MIITRGLGSNLLVTQGYGGVEIALVFPYCPGIDPYVSIASGGLFIGVISPYISSGEVVVEQTGIYTLSTLPHLDGSPICQNNPYFLAESGVGEYQNAESPFTQRDPIASSLPYAC
jgi:hypothetical protein